MNVMRLSIVEAMRCALPTVLLFLALEAKVGEHSGTVDATRYRAAIPCAFGGSPPAIATCVSEPSPLTRKPTTVPDTSLRT